MKILYISDSTIPSYSANSIHVMKMCNALAKNGHEVTLFSKNTKAILKSIPDVFKFYDVEKIFKLKVYPFFSFPGSGRFYNIFLPFFSFGSYDLVYTRAIYPAFWYSFFGKHLVFEIHEPFDTKSDFLEKIFAYILKRGKIKKWVVISAALKTYLMNKFSINEGDIIIAHDGADVMPESLVKLNLRGEIKAGYVGSLLKGKGVENIVPLSLLTPDITFHIVGGTIENIEFWKSKIGSEQNNIIFHGNIPHSETSSYIKSFDILLAPYQKSVYVKNENNSNNIAKWMSPLKIFEYMSSGKPIICSDLPVIREILRHQENALLCDPDNMEDWVNALNEINSDKPLAEKIAREAKSDFLGTYTWENRAKEIIRQI